jgi:uncharacterized protein (DUF983 family)
MENKMTTRRNKILLSLSFGARRLCPRCGEGKLFQGWGDLKLSCEHCHLAFEENSGDTWAFMYASTAFITGLFIWGMWFIHPTNRWLGMAVVIILSISTMLGTIPIRKGLAVALDYLFRLKE